MSVPPASAADRAARVKADGDKGYFSGYSGISIHETMLKDRNRTLAYKRAIQESGLFKDKVVVDVGCGTGILSVFAAQAGARHVYGIDASAAADMAREVVARNGLSDRITIIKGKVEEIECLPGLEADAPPTGAAAAAAAAAGAEAPSGGAAEGDGDASAKAAVPPSSGKKLRRTPEGCVDIIISEWMGYFLIYECMMASVAFARDRWLKPPAAAAAAAGDDGGGGLMFPDRARLFMAPVDDSAFWEDRCGGYWDDVYGVDLSCLRETARTEFLSEPLVRDLDPSVVLRCPGGPACLLDMDCAAVKGRKVDRFESAFEFVVPAPVAAPEAGKGGSGSGAGEADGTVAVHGFATWFHVTFPSGQGGGGSGDRDGSDTATGGCGTTVDGFSVPEGAVVLDTAPGVGALGTQHWRQTVFYLKAPLRLRPGDVVKGTVIVSPHPEYHRGNDIVLMFKAGQAEQQTIMYEFA